MEGNVHSGRRCDIEWHCVFVDMTEVGVSMKYIAGTRVVKREGMFSRTLGKCGKHAYFEKGNPCEGKAPWTQENGRMNEIEKNRLLDTQG